MGTLLQGATIITMNPQREVLEKADLLIERDRIEKIFPGGRTHKREGDELLDCSGKIIIPGLISAHTHLTGMLQRGLWDETSFESWSRKSAATEKFFDLSPDALAISLWLRFGYLSGWREGEILKLTWKENLR
ncbi:MAG TPA: hypothetical protein VLJ79_20005 [Candidatus Binatia bacterium]|nr:hypothetical protein [Candidatus Binatia bacterium]